MGLHAVSCKLGGRTFGDGALPPAELHAPCPTLQQLTEAAPPLPAYMGSREFLIDPPASDENGKTSDPLRIAMPG